MFDSLKKAIKTFTGKVADEAEPAPPSAQAPASAPQPAPEAPKPALAQPAPAAPQPAPAPPASGRAPAAKSKKDLDAELDAEIAAMEAELAAEEAKKAPATVAPKPIAESPRPAPPAAPKPADSKPAERKAVDIKPAEPAPAASAPPAPKPTTTTTTTTTTAAAAPPVVSKPVPSAAPVVAPPPAPKAAPAPEAPKARAPEGRAINVEKIDDLLWDLELSLLESDVALPVVEEIRDSLKQKLPLIRVASAEDVPLAVERALRESLLEALSIKPIDFDDWLLEKTMAKKPVVIMFVGVNGTGKTTSIGRVAHRLKENGYTSVMAAGDTFRAGAIQQLEKHAEKIGVTLVKTVAGGDPAAVAYDAIEHAKGRMKDVVLLDTAGRMQTNTNLMDEMKKIKRVAKPDMIIFVGDSLAGNDAVEQAIQFDKAVGIDAVVLTKVDTDAKGGAALSIAKAVGKPILFLGVGQEYGDLVPYDPKWMVDRIFEST